MKLSTKGRYAVRAMFDLALYEGGSPVSLREIAMREGISERYLGQIFLKLRKVGLIRAVRGAKGGYMLGRKPDEITLVDILEGVEGSLAPVSCVKEECERVSTCVVHRCWEHLYNIMRDFLSSLTLNDLCQRARDTMDIK